jgi:hypothetical protein
MLEVNPLIVSDLIVRMRQFHVKEKISIPEESSEASDDMMRQVLTDSNDDHIYDQIRVVINDLEPIQQAELVALLWLGREDFDASEWEAAVSEAKRSWNTRTAEYLLSTPLVADYLEDGLNQLGYELVQ